MRSSLARIPLHENVHPVLFGSIETQPLEETQRRIEALYIDSQWFPGSRRLVEQFPNQVTSHTYVSLLGQKSNIYDSYLVLLACDVETPNRSTGGQDDVVVGFRVYLAIMILLRGKLHSDESQ